MTRYLRGLLLALTVLLPSFASANDYYLHGSFPATGSAATSAGMRAELDLITAGFNKLPALTGNANRAVIVNGGGTALSLTTGTLTLPANLTFSGAYNTTFTTTGVTNVTLPTTGTLTTASTTDTLTNKTLNLASNTLTGTTAQFNTALSDGNFATLDGSETLTNKTLTTPTLTSPVLSGTSSGTYSLGGTPSLGAGTNLAAAGNDITGLDELQLTDAAAGATNAGRLRRNGSNIEWGGDGSESMILATQHAVDENPFINASLNIWQRGTTFAAVADGAYTADRFQWKTTGAGVVTINQTGTTPSPVDIDERFNYALEVDVTTADASIAATDTYSVRHKIEGHDWTKFQTKSLVLSFWVSSSKTGTHSVAIRNSGTDRYIIKEYTVNAADTYELKSVTIAIPPLTGAWNWTTGIGAEFIWNLACGSNFHGTVAGWQTGALYCSSNQVNVMDSTSNFFRVTGIKLGKGPLVTPTQVVPFATDLARAKRYYQKSFAYATAPAQNVGAGTGEERWMANVAGASTNTSPSIKIDGMRATPTTITLYNPAAANAQVRNITDGADLSVSASATASDRQFSVTATGTAGTAIGEILGVHWTADAEL